MGFFSIVLNWLDVFYHLEYGGARRVIIIVVENGHGDTSSNPGRDWLPFT